MSKGTKKVNAWCRMRNNASSHTEETVHANRNNYRQYAGAKLCQRDLKRTGFRKGESLKMNGVTMRVA